MIARLFSVIVLLYSLGFVIFSVTLDGPARGDAPRTDAAVVLTGGKGRIEHGLNVLRQRRTPRMLISGVDSSVTKGDLERLNPGSRRLMDCCVDLGSESFDTRSNAEETERWLRRRGFKSVRLITSDYHMRRARYEFTRVLGSNYKVIPDAIRTEPNFLTLFGEYNDYVLRRITIWFDV